MTSTIGTINAPLVGHEAMRMESTESLRAELERAKKRCQDLDYFIDAATHAVRQDGAVILNISGKQYRLERFPAGAEQVVSNG